MVHKLRLQTRPKTSAHHCSISRKSGGPLLGTARNCCNYPANYHDQTSNYPDNHHDHLRISRHSSQHAHNNHARFPHTPHQRPVLVLLQTPNVTDTANYPESNLGNRTIQTIMVHKVMLHHYIYGRGHHRRPVADREPLRVTATNTTIQTIMVHKVVLQTAE